MSATRHVETLFMRANALAGQVMTRKRKRWRDALAVNPPGQLHTLTVVKPSIAGLVRQIHPPIAAASTEKGTTDILLHSWTSPHPHWEQKWCRLLPILEQRVLSVVLGLIL